MALPDTKPQNAFQDDPLLREFASIFDNNQHDALSSIGMFVASKEAGNLTRLSATYPPAMQAGLENPSLDIHPGFQVLQRRAVSSGLQSILWESHQDEAKASTRHQMRAASLYLHAQLDAGHLDAPSLSNAALAILVREQKLFAEWAPLITSRKFDSADRAPRAKTGLTASIARMRNSVSGNAAKAQRGGNGLYRISGKYEHIQNPLADAWIVEAELNGASTLFWVPRRLGDGNLNGIKIAELVTSTNGLQSSPNAHLELHGAIGQAIGEQTGNAQASSEALNDAETLLRLDRAATCAGMARSMLSQTLAILQAHKSLQDKTIHRALSDIALDICGMVAIIFRIAAAFDNAAQSQTDAAIARLLAPIADYCCPRILTAIATDCGAVLADAGLAQSAQLRHHQHDAFAISQRISVPSSSIADMAQIIGRAPRIFDATMKATCAELGGLARSTADVLSAAAQLSTQDPTNSRLLAEQLYFAASGAELSRLQTGILGEAFLETRLGGRWRLGYGVLDARYDPTLILESLYPAVT